jgi:hypothetical protein
VSESLVMKKAKKSSASQASTYKVPIIDKCVCTFDKKQKQPKQDENQKDGKKYKYKSRSFLLNKNSS